jgi:hypothetical protein
MGSYIMLSVASLFSSDFATTLQTPNSTTATFLPDFQQITQVASAHSGLRSRKHSLSGTLLRPMES